MYELGDGEMQDDRPIMNLRQPRPTSFLHEDGSGNKVDSPHYQIRVQRSQTRGKIEEISHIRTFDEFVQKQI